jgi:hypothetical protein
MKFAPHPAVGPFNQCQLDESLDTDSEANGADCQDRVHPETALNKETYNFIDETHFLTLTCI